MMKTIYIKKSGSSIFMLIISSHKKYNHKTKYQHTGITASYFTSQAPYAPFLKALRQYSLHLQEWMFCGHQLYIFSHLKGQQTSLCLSLQHLYLQPVCQEDKFHTKAYHYSPLCLQAIYIVHQELYLQVYYTNSRHIWQSQ